MAFLPDTLSIPVGDVDGNGSADTLVLHKRSLRAAGYRLHTWTPGGGYTEVAAPEVRTYRGHVDTDPNLQVNAYLTPAGLLQANITNGTAHDEGGYWVRDLAVTVPDDPAGTPDGTTGNTVVPRTIDRATPTPRGYQIPRVTMSKMLVGVELRSDWIAALGGLDAAVALAEQRINDADHFYARDMGLAWEISEVVVRIDGDPGNWKSFWAGNDGIAPRNFNTKARFKPGGGGGSSGRIFQPTEGFPNSHSCTIGSTGPYARSLGHEVGHGIGAGHGSGNPCIMSGSDSAIAYGTVQRMIEEMERSPESATPEVVYNGALHPRAMEDCANTAVGQPVEIDVLENDYDGNGEALHLAALDPVSEMGGALEVVAGGVVRYTPAPGFAGSDTFSYAVADSTGLTNPTGAVKVYVRNTGVATHFTFDEASGTKVLDIGPYQEHATLSGSQFGTDSVPGVVGGALRLNSGAKISGGQTGDPLDGSFGVSMWVKYDTVPDASTTILYKGGSVTSPGRFGTSTFRGGWGIGFADGRLGFACKGQQDLQYRPQTADLFGDDPVVAGQWYHLAMAIDRGAKQLRAWIDGQPLTTTVNGTALTNDLIDNYLGLRLSGNKPVIVDEVRLYNHALTDAEVATLFLAQDDIPAGAPSPADRAAGVPLGTTLSWMPGRPEYTGFRVYLGTSEAAVAAADPTVPEFRGEVTNPMFHPATTPGQTWFWRIDELKSDGGVVTGPVWSFSTSPGILFTPVLDNPSFEQPVVRPASQVGSVTGWYEQGSYTYTTWEGDALMPETSSGDNWAELGNDKWLYQQIGVYAENKTVDISGFIGRKDGATYRGLRIRLHAGGDPAQAANGTTVSALGATQIGDSGLIKPALDPLRSAPFAVSLATGSGLATAGAPLWLEIRAEGGSGRSLVDGISALDPSVNLPPYFPEPLPTLPPATENQAYAHSLSGAATDPDGDDALLVFSKIFGPAWLQVAPDGTLSGTPDAQDTGVGALTVEVGDAGGQSARASFSLTVIDIKAPAGPPFKITAGDVDFQKEEITLRWSDTGMVYAIESSPDLSWTSAVSIPVDSAHGTVDTTAFPGEISFTFPEPAVSDNRRFYRVAGVAP